MVTRWNVDVNGYLYSQDDIRITSMISEEITCYVVDYTKLSWSVMLSRDVEAIEACVEILYIDSKR